MPADPERLSAAADLLRAARRLVVFTGAGISAESGIPTFRDADGLWQRFPPEQFASWLGLMHTALFQPGMLAEFLVAVLEPIVRAKPNAAHEAIARLEEQLTLSIITQNIDNLHQEAGSSRVREVHGSFFELVTRAGRPLHKIERADLERIVKKLRRSQTGLFKLIRLVFAVRPMLGLGLRGVRRPKLVLFGDALAEPDWSQAQQDADLCDVMLVVGTSGLIYPAAGLPGQARSNGAQIITVDPYEPGPSHVWLRGKAGDVVPELAARALAN